MNIAIVDDMDPELLRLGAVLEEWAQENHIKLTIKSFNSAESLLESFRPLQYTLIFMDIYMDSMTGMDAAKIIRQSDTDTLIVFLTTSRDHVFESFDVGAFYYILKSDDEKEYRDRLFKVMDKATGQYMAASGVLSFTSNRMDYHLPYGRIVYVQSSDHYVQITDSNRTCYRPRMRFSEVCDTLCNDRRFLQINRGILVNMDYITEFIDNTCVLDDEFRLPVSVRDYRNLDNIRRNYIFNKLHQR